MRKSLTIGGALLALAAFASTADARMMGGGGGTSMSPSMSHGAPMSASTVSPRGGFGTDGHTFSASGRTFSPDGFQTRVKGSNWKKPIDSDGGGPADPPPKPPKGSTETSSDGTGGYYPPHHHPHYGGPYQPYPNAGGGGNVPQRDCRGC